MSNFFFHKKDLESQLDFFKKFRKQDNNIGRWLISTSVFFILTIVSLIILNINIEETCKNLSTEQTALNHDLMCLQESSKSYKNLKQQNIILRNKFSKFDRNFEEKNSFLSALQKTSESIEDQTWIEKISLDKTTTSSHLRQCFGGQAEHKNKVSLKTIEILGYSSDPQEISSLHRNLSELSSMNNCKINLFHKSKTNPELVQFNFSNIIS